MTTLHPFWQNLYCKLLACLTILMLLVRPVSSAQPTGIIESFESLLDKNKKQYQKSISKLQKKTVSLSDINELQSVSLNKDFLRSLLLYTENKYLKFASDNECRLLSIIETGLAKTADGQFHYIPVILEFKNGKTENSLITKRDYFDYTYSKKCLNNREMLSLFNSKNIKQTMKSLKLPTPKNEKECSDIHDEWTKNSFTPYLCAISESIKRSIKAKTKLSGRNYNFQQLKKIERTYFKGDFFNKNIPIFHKEYFDSLCHNLYEPKKFCAPYLSNDVWNKINQKEEPSYKMTYKCGNIMGKKKLTQKDIEHCAKKFNAEPQTCTLSKNKDFSSLYPMPNCHTISESLLKSSLYTDYHDCPGKIDNQATTNIHRIVAHKKKLSISSDKISCSSQALHSLAQLSSDWPLQICYFDKISDKRNCIPYVPNHIQARDPLSEGHIIANILYRTEGALEKKACSLVSDKSYNPVLLKYKYGCFIIFDSQLCTTHYCKKRIVYESKEIKGIEYIGTNTFDYFTNSFKNEKFSMSNILKNNLKLESKIIHNLTILKVFLNKYPRAIAHGIGCAEDLMPSFFQKKSFGECRPLPFIVDGIIHKKRTIYLSFRSSIDDIHSPRLVPWDQIFNGVSNYKKIHPLNTWTLYGIK